MRRWTVRPHTGIQHLSYIRRESWRQAERRGQKPREEDKGPGKGGQRCREGERDPERKGSDTRERGETDNRREVREAGGMETLMERMTSPRLDSQ